MGNHTISFTTRHWSTKFQSGIPTDCDINAKWLSRPVGVMKRRAKKFRVKIFGLLYVMNCNDYPINSLSSIAPLDIKRFLHCTSPARQLFNLSICSTEPGKVTGRQAPGACCCRNWQELLSGLVIAQLFLDAIYGFFSLVLDLSELGFGVFNNIEFLKTLLSSFGTWRRVLPSFIRLSFPCA